MVTDGQGKYGKRFARYVIVTFIFIGLITIFAMNEPEKTYELARPAPTSHTSMEAEGSAQTNTVFVTVPEEGSEHTRYMNLDLAFALTIPSSWHVSTTPEQVTFLTGEGSIVVVRGAIGTDDPHETISHEQFEKQGIASVEFFNRSQGATTYEVRGLTGEVFTITTEGAYKSLTEPYRDTILTFTVL